MRVSKGSPPAPFASWSGGCMMGSCCCWACADCSIGPNKEISILGASIAIAVQDHCLAHLFTFVTLHWHARAFSSIIHHHRMILHADEDKNNKGVTTWCWIVILVVVEWGSLYPWTWCCILLCYHRRVVVDAMIVDNNAGGTWSCNFLLLPVTTISWKNTRVLRAGSCWKLAAAAFVPIIEEAEWWGLMRQMRFDERTNDAISIASRRLVLWPPGTLQEALVPTHDRIIKQQ